MNNDNLVKALGTFIDAMRMFTVSTLMNKFPDREWTEVFYQRLTSPQQAAWDSNQRNGAKPMQCIDYSNLSTLPTQFRDELADTIGGRDKTFTFDNCIRELRETRNKCQHFRDINERESNRAFSNMLLLADMTGMNELVGEIEALQRTITPAPPPAAPAQQSAAPQQPAQPAAEATLPPLPDDDSLRPWFQNCMPHYDIRTGNLDETAFAANLNEVAMGYGTEEYANPSIFFMKTYVTAGLRDLVGRVVRALNGEATGNRIISLQTGFGGGKTHSLISLYHVVKGGANLATLPSCAGILGGGVVPTFTDAKVVVFTQNTNDVVQGRQTPDGLTLHTLWGEIAYQLGGKEAYECIRPNDEQCIAPSSQLMKPILTAAGTSLILIDELADYCSRADGVNVGQGTLYDQTNSFVQTLTETVAEVPSCVLIVTLPASDLEVSGSAKGQTILSTLANRLSRYATSVKPVEDDEVYEVVRKRLFESINEPRVVDLVTRRYKRMIHDRISDLPQHSDSVAYAEKIKKAYPFHPELIDIFRLRWGSFHNFQRTRGVLRLLAAIVQDLWIRRNTLDGSRMLIHTSDVNLGSLSTLTDMVTYLMGPQWGTVMSADVYGTSSNAKNIDDFYPNNNIGKYALTQGVATSVLLASVGAQMNNAGLTMKELKLCMLRPKAFNHSDIDTAMNRLEATAHYLHTAQGVEKVYCFESKANINILLTQARQSINQDAIDAETLERLRQAALSTALPMKVLVDPKGDMPEQKSLTLIILHPTLTANAYGVGQPAKNTIEAIATQRANSNRLYRNTILYLLCSEAGQAALAQKVGGYLALQKVLTDFRGRLDQDQISDVQQKMKGASDAASVALAQAYCVVARRTAKEGILTTLLNQSVADLQTQISRNLTEHLKEEEWLLDSIGQALLRDNNLLPTKETPVRVKDIYEAFLRYDDKPMISSQEAIVRTVNRYCGEGLFNVAVGTQGNYTKVYAKEQIPFLDVTQDDYWLVDTSVTLAPIPEVADNPSPNTPAPTTTSDKSSKPAQDTPQPRLVRSLTIQGPVPLENWTQLFPSFINTLKNNRLKIEIKMTASSTDANPITDNSQIYASVKESASQLGLNFTEE